MSVKEILHIEDLKISYRIGERQFEAVRGMDISIGEGEIVGLVGESGCGKSTAARSILRLLPKNCTILAASMGFDGLDLLSVSDRDFCSLRGRNIALVSQNAVTAFNPLRRVGSQLREILLRNGIERGMLHTTIVRMLQEMGVNEPERMLRQYPHQCSGGMLQRALLGTAIACHPKLMIADEPTSSLDVTLQAHILGRMKRLSTQEGLAVLFITHDLNVAASICTRSLIMYGGVILEEGMTDDIFRHTVHPYTKALLNAIPAMSCEGIPRLTAIEGMPPSLIDMPEGCPFARRCTLRREECDHILPLLQEIAPGHKSRCPYVER